MFRMFYQILVLAGSSSAFMLLLFVMCIACLMATALMTFKKSRDKPDGYTVVATVDQE